MEKKSFFAKATSFFKRLGKSKPLPVEVEVIKDDKEKYENIWKDRERHFAEMRQSLMFADNDTMLIQTINGHIELYSLIYRKLGEIDGQKGARDFHFTATSTAHAQQLTEHIISTLTGRVKALDRTNIEKEEKLKERKDLIGEYRKEQVFHQKSDARRFSSFLGILYIVFALAMIIADIAVSLNLVNYFGIGSIPVDATFWDKVYDLELFLFSLGIAFCTVYVKILYDEYINNRLGSHITEMSRMPELNRNGLRTEWWTKLVFKLAILFGLCFLLYNLALYRTTFTIHSSGLTPQIAAIAKSEPKINRILLNCFIGISVIIPIISGICLSLGMQVFSNIRHRDEINDKIKSYENESDKLKNEIEETTSKKFQFQKHLDEWDKGNHKPKLIADLFSSSYRQGFKLGYRSTFGNDFYQLVEEYRNESIHKRLG